ncbi:hypothetical protein QJS10_CPB18g01273 [Acorus calamus]|uniref:Uncharacterized protein n=1 Tax=Acorus calamus TaxID=4465 RepID=A0AAV9CNR8_ACOCL|nr:hypothetical protein QJS10_CPB18g01273 [Acorus calamus]
MVTNRRSERDGLKPVQASTASTEQRNRKPGRRWFSSVVKKKVHPGSATADEAGSSMG